MPEGMVPELLIALGLLALIGGVLFFTRRGRDSGSGAPPVVGDPTAPSRASERVQERGAPTATAVLERPSLRERLVKSRKFLTGRLADAVHGAPDDETWDDVEAVLIQADIGVETAARITADLKEKARERRVTDADSLRELLAEELVELFDTELDRGLAF